METRANLVAVGAFVLALMGVLLGFAYWISGPTGQAAMSEVNVEFAGDVTGLVIGAPVYFNGIRVGEVKQMTLDPEDPNRVVARVTVADEAPLKEDSTVKLGFQGLTGVAFVQFSGGSIEAPRLVHPDEEPPFILAERSAFEDILEGARDLLVRVNRIAGDASDILADNKDNITSIVGNFQAVSQAVADNADNIGAALDAVGELAETISAVSGSVVRVSEQAEALLAAVDPNQVSQAVEGVSTFATGLGEVADDLPLLMADLRQASGELQQFAEGLNTTLASLDTVIAGVNPESIAEIVDAVRTVSASLASKADAIEATIDNTQNLTANVADLSGSLAQRSEEFGQIVDNTNALTSNLATASQDVTPILEQVQTTLGSLDGIVASVDTESLQQTVEAIRTLSASLAGRADVIERTLDNTEQITATLSGATGQVERIVTNTETLTQNLADASTQIGPTLEEARGLLTAFDADGINATIANVRKVTDALAERTDQIGSMFDNAEQAVSDVRQVTSTVAARRDDIDRIITDVTEVAAQLNGIATRAGTLIDQVNAVVGEADTDGLFAEATAAASAIREVAEAFARRADEITAGVANFSGRGLQNAEALISDGRRTVQSLDRLLNRIEQNPRDFLFGASSGPRDFDARRF